MVHQSSKCHLAPFLNATSKCQTVGFINLVYLGRPKQIPKELLFNSEKSLLAAWKTVNISQHGKIKEILQWWTFQTSSSHG